MLMFSSVVFVMSLVVPITGLSLPSTNMGICLTLGAAPVVGVSLFESGGIIPDAPNPGLLLEAGTDGSEAEVDKLCSICSDSFPSGMVVFICFGL